MSINPNTIENALLVTKAISPLRTLKVESKARKAPILPIVIPQTKLKKVNCQSSFLPISRVRVNKVIC